MNERETFETTAPGALPTDWTAVSGTWQVHTTTPPEGSRAFGQPNGSVTDGNVVRRDGVGQADMRIRVTLRVQMTDPSNLQSTGVFTRLNAAGNTGYLFNPGWGTNSFALYLFNGGISQVGSDAPTGFVAANGDVVHLLVESQGTAHRFKVWKTSETEPELWSGNWTNATVASGNYGLRTVKAGTFVGPTVVDDVRASDAGSDWVLFGTTYTLTGPTSGPVGSASSNFTVTPDGFYEGDFTPSDGGAGGTFSPTSLTWAGEPTAQTFTYTPSTAGVRTIGGSASPFLTPPANITFSAFAGASRLVGPVLLTSPAAPVGITVLNADGTEFISRTTSGVVSDDDTFHWARPYLPTVGAFIVKFDDTSGRQVALGVDYGR